MIQFSHPDIKKLLVCGDVHGEFKLFFHQIRMNVVKKVSKDEIPFEQLFDAETVEKLMPYIEELPHTLRSKMENYAYDIRGGFHSSEIKDCVIIVAGDCGFGFNKEEYYHQIFNKYMPLLEKNNIYVYFVRGNHDDPSYFEEQKINYERIKTIPDYSVIQIDENNILCVGGAISIDRTWRKQEEVIINKHKSNKKVLYWENELPIYCQEKLEEIISNGITINGIVSHSSPHFAYPTQKNGIKSWARIDKKLYEDIDKERHVLTNIYDFFKSKKQPISFWCYGHYHSNNNDTYDKTKFYALNEMRMIPIQLKEISIKDALSNVWDSIIPSSNQRDYTVIHRNIDGEDVVLRPLNENVDNVEIVHEERQEQIDPLIEENVLAHLRNILYQEIDENVGVDRRINPIHLDNGLFGQINEHNVERVELNVQLNENNVNRNEIIDEEILF